MSTTKDAPAALPAKYKGWFRSARGQPWRCLVEDAATYDEVWGRLLELAPRGEQHGELLVSQMDPNQ